MIVTALTPLAIALLLGGGLGAGLCLLASLTMRLGRPTLARRIAPYVRDVTDPEGRTSWAWLPSAGRSSATAAVRRALATRVGGTDAAALRLRQAGRHPDVAVFRGTQLTAAIVGVVIGGVVLVGLALTGSASPAYTLVPALCGAGGAAAQELRLTRAAKRRTSRIEEELPTVLEFLALCLAAGEGMLDAVRRVAAVGAGELTGEFRGVVVAVSTGSSLGEALARMASDLQIPALGRSVDHLVAAIERGAPLAQVLQAQAADAREDAKRVLIERAGRKEIAMLVPLVFLILPLSVLFAVFPGVFMLRLGIN